MTTVVISPIFNGYQSFLASGLPNVNGFINTYIAATNTPQATYTDYTGTIANPVSIPLNAAGFPPNGIWLIAGGAYKFVVIDASSNVISTYDNIYTPCPATSGTSILKGNGLSGTVAAVSGVDFVIPSGTVANATNAVNATNATNATTAVTVSTTVASGAVGTTKAVGTNDTTLATTAHVYASVVPAPQSMVRLTGYTGTGAVNTCIAIFTTIVTNQGSDITYATSANNGDSFTVNKNGVYAISQTMNQTSANWFSGISKNSTQLTTPIYNITAADRLSITETYANTAATNCSWTGYLSSGDVIRSHTDAGASGALTSFTIVRTT